MYCLGVPIPILQIRSRSYSTRTGNTLAWVQSLLGVAGRPNFLPLEGWWFVPALPTEENWLSAATVPRTVCSNQGSAGRGGTEWRALCFLLPLAWLLSAWKKFMLSLCHRKSARPAGDRYLRGACRPRRLSPRALGTMRYPRSRPGKPLPSPSLLEPRPRPPAREPSCLLAPLALLCPPNARLRLGCLVPQSHRWPRISCFLMIIIPFAWDAFKARLIEGSANFNFGEFDIYFISR